MTHWSHIIRLQKTDNNFPQVCFTTQPMVPDTVLVRIERLVGLGHFAKGRIALVAACLLAWNFSAWAQGQNKSPISPPDSTSIQPVDKPLKDTDPEPVLTGKSVVLPLGFSRAQLMDLLEVIGRQIQSSAAYTHISPVPSADPMNKAAADFDLVANYQRTSPGQQRILQLGVQMLQTRAGLLVVQGYQISEGKHGPNPDVDAVLAVIQQAVLDLTSQKEELLARDLPKMIYQLSYVEAQKALDTLKVMGYQVVDSNNFKPEEPIDSKKLPLVFQMPDPQMTFLAGIEPVKGAKGIMLPGEAIQEFDKSTTGGPMERLLIMYSPDLSNRSELNRLLELLKGKIDVPAPQMLIEGMVLEVSETGVKQLGLEYELGRFDAAGENPRYSATFQQAAPTIRPLVLSLDSSIVGALDRYRMILRALIREGKAQVLARPSILALNNRQARIRITTEVPISSTAVTELTTDVKVEYISVGIVLNIRPRMNSIGEEISFQIDASVSDIDPTSPFRIQINPDSLTGAQAPVVLTRQVQTYARVRNNTPLIVGGLIAKRSSDELDRVPFLSNIPILGWLFKNQANSTERREVIIVLTPYVLPETVDISRAMPKDSDMFDEIDPIDPMLFRAIYRIRIQDVFDMSFLRNNPELNELTAQAKELIQDNPDLSQQPPFDAIAADQVPGETILVERMVYQIIKKLGLIKKISPSNLLIFKKDPAESAGFEVRFLTEELTGLRQGNWAEYFKQHPNRALALTFKTSGETHAQEVIRESVPEVHLLELSDRNQWKKLLYELNQPVNGVQRWTILINDEKDMERLQAALVLKRTIDLNRTDNALYIKHFRVGRQLAFPVISPERTYLIDWEVARYFYHTEHYYAAFQDELNEGMKRLREMISRFRKDPGLLTPPSGFTAPVPSKT